MLCALTCLLQVSAAITIGGLIFHVSRASVALGLSCASFNVLLGSAVRTLFASIGVPSGALGHGLSVTLFQYAPPHISPYLPISPYTSHISVTLFQYVSPFGLHL